MEIRSNSCWTWIRNNDIPRGNIIGKYLFFSDNKEELIELAKVALSECKLHVAKVPYSNVPNKNKGFGFVLCIYDTSKALMQEMKKYETNTVTYRFFKTDEDTRQKKYSTSYLQNKL